MTNYLFDTNLFIYAFKEDGKAVELLERSFKPNKLYLSVIVVAEIYASNNQEFASKIDELSSCAILLPVDYGISVTAGQLRAKTKKTGKAYLADCLIAATAVHHDLTLITNNKKDFSFPGLKLKVY